MYCSVSRRTDEAACQMGDVVVITATDQSPFVRKDRFDRKALNSC